MPDWEHAALNEQEPLDFGFWIESVRRRTSRNHWILDREGATVSEQELKDRTKRFALPVIRLVEGLPKNYRAACRAKSPADMVAKLAIVEADLEAETRDQNSYRNQSKLQARILRRKQG